MSVLLSSSTNDVYSEIEPALSSYGQDFIAQETQSR
ncbi:hypothetical protein J2S35_000538 [Falsarthrobacter nasiphocae]|uniref:Uncharacterized protein n=1 Tax=Falsarthrobacter nasiphocae TaxID=189863 RepID=A0AAE3YGN3_9MICC|nr:hypothetical protein [Falsarthrobacter nasiphocae]